MDKVIENGQLVDDAYCLISDKESMDISLVDSSVSILPLTVYQQNKDNLPATNNAIWLDSDEPPALIADNLDAFSLIAINFPAFTDGRGYSFAFELRETYHFKGTLRAVGDVLLDQLTALRRVGFDSFALREDQDPIEALAHFQDFKVPYQASVEPNTPLFRKL